MRVKTAAAKRDQASVWDCKACVDQMFNGVRCPVHNAPIEAHETTAAVKE